MVCELETLRKITNLFPNEFYGWTQNTFQPFYDDFGVLKERFVTRFGGDDEDLNQASGSHQMGDDDIDPMEP